MSRYARIAITLPKPDLAAADRLARRHARPRSWVIAEAVRRFADAAPATAAATFAAPSTPGLGESRLAQLRRDLALTPEARVRAAEETVRLAERVPGPKARYVIAFARFQDYIDWRRGRDRLR